MACTLKKARKPELPMQTDITVLIVDDEADFTSVLSKRLCRLGLSVRTASDGAEAYAALETTPVDVVVLDMNLPGLNGLEVLKIIRKNFLDVQVILLTGDGNMVRAMRSIRAGAFDFLHKPVSTDQLWQRIREAAEA